jgi:hypothetical protein
MGEIRTVTTLIAKRDEIERPIAGYESRLARAKADLSHVNAVSIFEAAGDRDTTTSDLIQMATPFVEPTT